MTSTAQRAPAARPSGEVPGGGIPGARGPDGRPVLTGWRQWRAPVAVMLLVLLGGLIVALLQVRPPVAGPLDPNDTGPSGAHALVALLDNRGQTVLRTGSAATAAAQAQARGTTLVVTSPQELSGGELAQLARVPAGLVLVAPGPRRPRRAGPGGDAGRAGQPGPRPAAALRPARRGRGRHARTWAGCRCGPPLPEPGAAIRPSAVTPFSFSFLVRYAAPGHLVTVLGTGAPLANANLGASGNAALALNLLAASPRIVWLVPGPLPAPAVAHPGQHSLTSLVPGQVWAVVIQLGIVVVLLALWRMRRLGPLVTEPLPVVVRACETVEGHGRLYRSRRARDRAAAALRDAALGRIVIRLGLPRDVTADAACQELASRTGRDSGEIRAILFGPVPGDDAALVKLAADLDALEGQVLTL